MDNSGRKKLTVSNSQVFSSTHGIKKRHSRFRKCRVMDFIDVLLERQPERFKCFSAQKVLRQQVLPVPAWVSGVLYGQKTNRGSVHKTLQKLRAGTYSHAPRLRSTAIFHLYPCILPETIPSLKKNLIIAGPLARPSRVRPPKGPHKARKQGIRLKA